MTLPDVPEIPQIGVKIIYVKDIDLNEVITAPLNLLKFSSNRT